VKRNPSAASNMPSHVQDSTNFLCSPLLVTSSTGCITRVESQLHEASQSFILFVKVPLLYYPPISSSFTILPSHFKFPFYITLPFQVPLLYYPPIYATSQVLSSLIPILRQTLCVHFAFVPRGNVCFGISNYLI
jgi:hypothetical protein